MVMEKEISERVITQLNRVNGRDVFSEFSHHPAEITRISNAYVLRKFNEP